MTLEAVVTELRMLREEVGKICADVGTVKEIMVEMMEGKKLQRKKDAERKKPNRRSVLNGIRTMSSLEVRGIEPFYKSGSRPNDI